MLASLNFRNRDAVHRSVPVLLFVISLALYLATMSRGITWLNTGPDGYLFRIEF
ncbi:MAG: hypothetical protein VYA50_09295 [Chloroflexota bacterium]|nr:hypothetical protein [Chloroflexota bacterium]